MHSMAKKYYFQSLCVLFGTYFIICVSGRHVPDSPPSAGQSHRQNQAVSFSYRNGGFQKFPVNTGIQYSLDESREIRGEQNTCGQRNVFHDMDRMEKKRASKIIGGSQVPYGAYPWTANLELKYRAGSYHQCGGAIISSHHILTAAHCLDGYKAEEFRVKVGDDSRSKLDEHEQSFDVESWKIHPKFQVGGMYMNDLAVLKLRGNGVVSHATVSAACLPAAHTVYSEDTWCYVTGWGFTTTDSQDKPDRLHAASIPLVSEASCASAAVHGSSKLGPGMLCAGYLEGEVDACGGDSGGPLVCEDNGRFKVLGIVSWGRSCAQRNKPGVYTKVQYYLDWIHKAINEL